MPLAVGEVMGAMKATVFPLSAEADTDSVGTRAVSDLPALARTAFTFVTHDVVDVPPDAAAVAVEAALEVDPELQDARHKEPTASGTTIQGARTCRLPLFRRGIGDAVADRLAECCLPSLSSISSLP